MQPKGNGTNIPLSQGGLQTASPPQGGAHATLARAALVLVCWVGC